MKTQPAALGGLVGRVVGRLVGQRRVRRLFIVGLVVAGILFTFANPARTALDQRQEIAAARERTAVLDQQIRALQSRADTLATDAEVERLARQDYGMVKPGEEAFGILPTPGARPAPPTVAAPPKPRPWWRSAWDTATFWS
ncbi:MAG: septum formation initiator family protein [Acidimicrobiales bacterium]